jgi:2-methylisocitrate lyase-like PEP mutase family enzyme
LSSQKEKAEKFRSLHHKTFCLPNAWDVPSARIFENSGFPAVATSSAGLMVSLGYRDGESIGKEEFLSAVGRISRVLSIPLSVDIVAGFGERPSDVADMVKRVIEVGGIGVNIEDFDHRTKSLFPLEKQLEKLKAAREQAVSMDIPLVINARTDALRYAPGDEGAKLNEAIRRAKAFKDSSAVDCVYPMGLTERNSISLFVDGLGGGDFPINVMIRKGLPTLRELESLGIRRVSFGPSASYAAMGLLKRASSEILEQGTFNLLIDGAISFDELDSLADPRKTA